MRTRTYEEKKGATCDVKRMYEDTPYGIYEGDSPYMTMGAGGLRDTLGAPALKNLTILDAGCGAGGQLVTCAQRFPDTHFVGLDMTEHSLKLAQKKCDEYNLKNVTLKQGNILTFDDAERYKVITSRGVLHHLENPAQGIRNLRRLLHEDGVMITSLYHTFGEFERMLDRELVFSFWRDRQDMTQGKRIMEALNLSLSSETYGIANNGSKAKGGSIADDDTAKINQMSWDVDAYLHPIVHAYSFDDLFMLFRDAGFDWVAIDQVFSSRPPLPGHNKRLGEAYGVYNLDLGHTDNDISFERLSIEHFLPSAALADQFETLDRTSQLRIVELLLRPALTGLVAGRHGAEKRLTKRLKENVVTLS